MAEGTTRPAGRASLLAQAALASRLARATTNEQAGFALRAVAAELTLQASSMEGTDMDEAVSLHRVVYCSRNAIAEADADVGREVEAVLDASRRNNQRDGITGALVYSEGCFAQALEGPAAAVERCFGRIQRDFRHADVTVLESRPVQTRLFGDWSMAYGGVLGSQAARLRLRQAFTEPRSLAAETVVTLLHDVVRGPAAGVQA